MVGNRVEQEKGGVKIIKIREVNWIGEKIPEAGKIYMARSRYREALQEIEITQKSDHFLVTFLEAQQTISPGQSLVIYDEDICLGGGIITE